jgi:serine/threonine-protein kinase
MFGPYEIESLLGSGGMGEVYRARDTRRQRHVALKLLPELLGDDQEYQSRFRREQYVAARLREPHVIPIHDFGEIDGRLFIDMRLVDGADIGSLLDAEGPIAPGRCVALVGQIAEALAAAHADGLVHRDVKPSNVLVTPSDFVYVVDFGIARSIGMTRTSLTMTGATIGTLDYMAPERFTGLPIDGRADVYSLACLLHQCLTGSRPFGGDDLPSLMYAHLYNTPPPASALATGISPALDAVIARGMAKRPEDRFQTVLELATAARDAAQAPAQGHGQVPHPAPPTRKPVTVVVPPPAPPAAAPPAAAQPAAVPPDPDEGARAPHDPRATPLPVSGWGVASADGGHRSVDHIRTTPGGQPPVPPPLVPGDDGPRPPGAAQPGGGRRPRRRRALLSVVALVVAALLVGGFLVLRRGADDGDGAGPTVAAPTATNAAATETAAPPAVAGSLPIPFAGETVGVGATPGYIQVAPNGRYAYIANREARVVTVFDTTLEATTATIPIAAGPPQFITFAPDGRTAYVTVYDADLTVNAVVFLDTATNTEIRTVDVGLKPYAPATSPDGTRLYVPSHNEGVVDIIDIATGTMVDVIRTPPNPHWVVFSNDGRIYYTADHESGVVTAFSAADNAQVAEIPVGKAPHSLAVSPDGTQLSVVCYDSNELWVIDTATNAVLKTIPLDARPQDVTYAPDGKHLYTANVDGGTVQVVDTATIAVTATLATGDSPTSISVLPDGTKAYVTNLNDGTVRILDTAAL